MAHRDTVVSAIMAVIFAGMAALATGYPPEARFVPLLVAGPATMLAAWQLARDLRTRPAPESGVTSTPHGGRNDGGLAIAWLAAFVLMVLAGGFVVGGTLAVVLCQRFWLRESWRTTLISGALSLVVLLVCFQRLLGLLLYEGWLAAWIQ
jgi:amino acid permease